MKIRLFFALLILTVFSGSLKAQFYFNRVDSIEVQLNNIPLKFPWAGGENFLSISDIDLNYDGIMDLFVFDRTGNKVSTYINNGTPNIIDYRYAHQYIEKFPKMDSWALLRDYNCDGKMDIFTHTNLGIKLYKNDGNAITGLHFTLVKQTIYCYFLDNTVPPSNYLNLYVTGTDIPAIYDEDGDGDLDILTFDFAGSHMQLNKNFSMENYGVCDSLNSYILTDECYGDFSENFSNNSVVFDVCAPIDHLNPIPVAENGRELRHSGSCTLCADLNGDTLKDLILGDISFPNVTMLVNGGTAALADMTVQDIAFPSYNMPVNVPLFPCCFYVDVNNDSVRDLLVSPNSYACSANNTSLWYYKNVNKDDSAKFIFQQNNFLQNDMIDVGEGAYPAFFDFDSDGLMDIIIGNYGIPNGSCTYVSKLTAYKNIGTPSQPKFSLFSRDYASLGAYNLTNMIPTFGDIDYDGDIDMIIGTSDGRLYYFQNNAAAGLPANFTLNTALFSSFVSGLNCAPQLVDVNRDGKLDLLIGRSNGRLNYHKNFGTTSNPAFSVDTVNANFGGVNVTPVNTSTGNSFPALWDDNGSYKLLVGASDGKIFYYTNIDGNLNGNFTIADSTLQDIYEGSRAAPAIFDINFDGQKDMILGNYSGGLHFYIGDTTALVDGLNMEKLRNELQVYPNPANDKIFFKLPPEVRYVNVQINLFNVQGKLVDSKNCSNGEIMFCNTAHLPPGIYFVKLFSSSFVLTTKIIIQH